MQELTLICKWVHLNKNSEFSTNTEKQDIYPLMILNKVLASYRVNSATFS